MRNIFLIPTSMESRLWRDLDSNKLTFSNLSKPNSNECTKCSNEYVHITSDEESVYDKDYYLYEGSAFQARPRDEGNFKNKVILTTDPDFIKDGVQAIDDDFLEWFVKNPNCEEVEIYRTGGHYDGAMEFYIPSFYKIILPIKNFYCGDEVDYGEQCSFQCENCNDATGVDYGYITKMGVEVKDEMVRPLMVPKNYFGEVETLSEKLEKIVSKEPSKFVEESNERFRIREEKKLKEAFDEIYNSIDFTEFDFASFKLGVKWEQDRNK
jgi:hypothetical protein